MFLFHDESSPYSLLTGSYKNLSTRCVISRRVSLIVFVFFPAPFLLSIFFSCSVFFFTNAPSSPSLRRAEGL